MTNRSVIEFKNMPMPPTVNKCYATIQIPGKGVRRISTTLLKDFKTEFEAWANNHSSELEKARSLLNPPPASLRMHFKFGFPWEKLYIKAGGPRKLDVSNRIKPIEDELCRVLDLDDRYVFTIIGEKEVGRSSVEVRIEVENE